MFGIKDIWAAVSFKNYMTEQGLSQWEEWLHIGTKDQYTLDILNALHSIWWGGGAGIEYYYWLALIKKTLNVFHVLTHSWCCHDTEVLSILLALCEGNPPIIALLGDTSELFWFEAAQAVTKMSHYLNQCCSY